ncbi:hypothetical protein [Paractinoplanes toevensis]|uniref:BMP family ABC transporter substrate-binding protein n=1 Tax=Paractinoplanes toevensis TaxID=571911 RepID=A0A920BRN7_9ACTN|nr:hypothetical protein [Actinoplanes toevensis]GIM97816.1 hypothetical protein Ato02nite_096090 [Actinoplanes toevensis]
MRWLAGGALVLVLAVVGLVVWLSDDGVDLRARVYTQSSACLLTPAAGVSDPAAAPVWAGMQQASLATNGKVSFLEVDGRQTAENAATYLATLAQGDCDLVLVAGAGPVAALEQSSASFPQIHFVSVGGSKAQANVSVVADSDANAVSAQVKSLVESALRSGE